MPISRIYTLHKNLEGETYKPLQDTKLAPQNGDICTVWAWEYQAVGFPTLLNLFKVCFLHNKFQTICGKYLQCN